MMRPVLARASWIVVSLLGCSVPLVAEPAESARERSLEKLVQQLIRRVDSLEREVQELKSARGEPGPATTEVASRDAEKAKPALQPRWDSTLTLASRDEDFKVKIGGRIQNDWAFFSEDAGLGNVEDGVEFRRSRLAVSGNLYGNVEFKAQYDLADGDADFSDVYVGLRDFPYLGRLRVGHFLEPFSLENLTSNKYLTFMERALPNAFAPVRNMGIAAQNAVLGNRMTVGFGVFRDTDSYGDGVGDGNYALTGRVTGLPWFEEDGERLLHLGFSYRYQNPDDDELQFRARPEAHLAPYLLDSGAFGVKSEQRIALEAAAVSGPFSIQGEYLHSFADVAGSADPDFAGYYVQGSYFLTGERRPYSKTSGVFSMVRPKRNFGQDGGPGAWEVAARFSSLDLNSGNISGGEEDNWTLGLNWYLNPNLRLTWNYVHADIDAAGDLDALQMRLQVAF